MPPLTPGVPLAMFSRFDAQMQVRGRIALSELADGLKRQAKENANNGRHKLGTPSLSPGDPVGPSVISGALRRSIDRTSVSRQSYGWLCQVGLTAAQSNPYNKVHTSVYGRVLELEGVRRSGKRFPFLYSAFNFAATHLAHVIYTKKYGSDWVRLI